MKKILISLLVLLLLTGCSNNKRQSSPSDVTIIEGEKVPAEDLLTRPGNDYEEREEEKVEEEKIIIPKDDNSVIINYFNTYINEVDNSPSFTDKLQDKFNTLTNFIFYGGTINNMTFKDLSTSAKSKVIELYEKIDNKLNEKFPNYKEKVKDKYEEIKNKLSDLKKEYIDSGLYKEIAIQEYDKVKETVEPVLEEGKERVVNQYKESKEKLKEYYEKRK